MTHTPLTSFVCLRGRWSRIGPSSTACRSVVLGAAGLLGAVSPLVGLGVRIPNQDATAVGRGNAFVATADTPAAIYYNPAGLTQLDGQEVQLGLLGYLGAQVTYESNLGYERKSDSSIIPVPELQYVYSNPDAKFAVGLGVYTPFGLKIDWPDDTGFRTLAQSGEMMYGTINPVVAYQVLPQLSLAAGPTFNYSSLKVERGIAVPGDSFSFDGDGWSTGFNVGVRWQPHEKWALGASYRFGPSTTYRGDSELSPYAPATSTETEFNFPQVVMGGISFRPTPRWNLEFNVDWTDWSEVDDLVLRGVAGGDQALPLYWEPSFFYELGATYTFDSGYFLSAGYYFSESSTPDETFTPLVPDPNIHVGSLGVGQRGEHWRWAVAFQLFVSGDRTVTGSPTFPPFFETADGTYSLLTPAVSASVGYRF